MSGSQKEGQKKSTHLRENQCSTIQFYGVQPTTLNNAVYHV